MGLVSKGSYEWVSEKGMDIYGCMKENGMEEYRG